MILIAVWKLREHMEMEPDYLTWADGSHATPNDYWDHYLDTHCERIDERGYVEVRYFPGIIGDVVYDQHANDWIVKGEGVLPTALALHDPSATDEQIESVAWTFPIVYKVRIVRGPLG